jgi:hypothetical protein
MTYLFLTVLACTLALGGWLLVRADSDLPFHRLSDRAARRSAFENAARVVPPLGARRTLKHPTPAEGPAQLSPDSGVGPDK